jgi:hypothetical protein
MSTPHIIDSDKARLTMPMRLFRLLYENKLLNFRDKCTYEACQGRTSGFYTLLIKGRLQANTGGVIVWKPSPYWSHQFEHWAIIKFYNVILNVRVLYCGMWLTWF